jgi:hypothetical protein
MMRRLLPAICLAVLGVSGLWAHHSLTAEYDQKKPVSLDGTLTKLDWRNPHAWIYVDVKNANGGVDNWRCELDPLGHTPSRTGPGRVRRVQ